jgi:hypothetical protein
MKRSTFLLLYLTGFAVAILLGSGCGSGVKPIPVPPTQPAPIPVPPEPVAAPAGVVIVEDTAAADQTRGRFLADRKIQAFFKASNLSHAIVTPSAVDPDGKPVGGTIGKLIAAAKDKPLPYLFVLDAKGKVLKDQPCPLDPDAFVSIFVPTHPRQLGMTVAKPKLKWVEFGSAAAPTTKLIPRDQWQPIDLEAYLPPVHDQDGRGQCNASATCTAIEASREIAGMSYVYLSAGDLYSQINGGRDDGSLLEDGLDASIKSGVAPSTLVPYVWDGRRHDTAPVKSERRKYRVTEAYLCPTFDHVGSALQQGFLIVEGVLWFDNFTPDADGWLPLKGRGNYGGHALCGYGLANRPTSNGGDVWGVRTRNSWGVGWGIGGNCVIPETLFDGNITGYWAVRSTVRTPEPFPPSEPARRTRLSLSPVDGLQLAP